MLNTKQARLLRRSGVFDTPETYRMPFKPIWIVIVGIIILIAGCRVCHAENHAVDVNKLANAIRIAEGVKSRHPYGILAHYKTTTPRQACINTIKSALKRYNKAGKRGDFIAFLGKTYCPVGASNDPKCLNKNWVQNVQKLYKGNV